MRRVLWLAVSLVVVASFIYGGCTKPESHPQPAPISEEPSAGHPQGMKSPRLLTSEEKEKVLEIALKTPTALKQLEKDSHYNTKLSWIAIVWDSSEYEYSEWRGIDYEWETDDNLRLVSASAEFYSRVVINFGEPPQWQVMTAINPDTGKVALVEEHPFRTGPTPPK